VAPLGATFTKEDVLFVFQSKKGMVASALSLLCAPATIYTGTMADVVTTEIAGIANCARAIWLDIPSAGQTLDKQFYINLSQLVRTCKHTLIPLIITIHMDGKIVDSHTQRLLAWQQMCAENEMQFQQVCSCNLPKYHNKPHHVRKLVFACNTPYHHYCLPTCIAPLTGRVTPNTWTSYYRALASAFWKPISRLGTGSRWKADSDVQVIVVDADNSEGCRIDAAPIGAAHHKPPYSNDSESLPSQTTQGKLTSGTDADPGPQRLPDSFPVVPPPGLQGTNYTLQPTSHSDQLAYPTDSKQRRREREKAAKEAGTPLEVKKKKKVIEDHFDDCGEDLRSLNIDEDSLSSQFTQQLLLDPDQSHFSLDEETTSTLITDGLATAMFYGYVIPNYVPPLAFHTQDIDLAFLTLNKRGSGVDISEVCGGEARASRVCVRRKLTAGPNFDLVVDCDLSRRKDQQACINYHKTHKVLVAVLAPICGPFGPMSNLNWHLHPDTMWQKYAEASPVCWTCGQVALIQLKRGLDFLAEQPHPSKLFDEHPWPQILKYPNVEQVVYDRCRCGLRVLSGPWKGYYWKKPSSMTVSCPELAYPFQNTRCLGNHQHMEGDGHPKELSQAQVWTWQEASRVANGVGEVVARHKRGYTIYEPAYILYSLARIRLQEQTPLSSHKEVKIREHRHDARLLVLAATI